MKTLEYEVRFIFEFVNVLTLAYIDDCEDENETYRERAIRRAGDTIANSIGLDVGDADEVTVELTGTIG